jgi:flavin-dependent dehydrogenase
MSKDLATLSSTCYARRLPVKIYREKLRVYAKSRGFKIVEEWMDCEAWYRFKSYQHKKIFVIGGAASFTDQAFGFGIKFVLRSAEICAQAIIEKKDYRKLLRPLQKELHYWQKLSPYFVTATTDAQDRYIRLLGRFPVRQLIERGRSIKAFSPIIRALFK